MRNVASLMSCGEKPWVPLIGVMRYISYAPALVAGNIGTYKASLGRST